MHGRLKIRTTEQERELKRQKQLQRMHAYRTVMDSIFAKRARDELDDELLALTGQLLTASPDIGTLWNIRRDCLLRLQRADPDTNAFRKELQFTLDCLKANPKSYCGWHHRRWCLDTWTQPDFEHELDLCTKYLQLDERNFHVWQHRSYVVEKSGIAPADELVFCSGKIDRNFSNYSSWHYRSKLLPALFPHPTNAQRPIDEDTLRAELELVLNATFTAPEDSSAWFYQRWLLGYSAPALGLAAFKVTESRAIVTLTRPVDLHRCQLRLGSNARFETSRWRALGVADGVQHSCIWLLSDSFALNADSAEQRFELQLTDEDGRTHALDVRKAGERLIGVRRPQYEHDFEESVRAELLGQLRSYDELRALQRDMNEPDSKWALLTTALLMRSTQRSERHDECVQRLRTLCTVDPMRSGYYRDLADKWTIERALEQWIEAGCTDDRLTMGAGVASLHYDQYLCVVPSVDLGVADRPMRASTERKLEQIYAACGVEVKRGTKC